MELLYFVVDQDGQLCHVPRQAVEDLWRGHRTTEALDCPLGEELRLISVLRDEDLTPKICFFVRLEIDQSRVTEESRIEAYESMESAQKRRYDNAAAQRQFAGWPIDWQSQLAVALDVPSSQLRKLGIGGPLLMSDLWGISLEKVLEYFEMANDE